MLKLKKNNDVSKIKDTEKAKKYMALFAKNESLYKRGLLTFGQYNANISCLNIVYTNITVLGLTNCDFRLVNNLY